MGTMNALYLRKGKGIPWPDIRNQCTEENDEWWYALLPDYQFEFDDEKLKELSLKHGTALFLSFQSLVDAFQFILAENGGVVRKLIYGCFVSEREWEVIEGVPKEWEEMLLNKDDLNVGVEASLDSKELCRKIAEFYTLPGW